MCGTYALKRRGRGFDRSKVLSSKDPLSSMGKILSSMLLSSMLLSIAEIERNDFKKLYRIIPETLSVELDLSCGYLNKSLPWDSTEIFARTKGSREWCICKVLPTVSPEELEFLIVELGFTQIHLANAGFNREVILDTIHLLRDEWPEVEVIAGERDVEDFSGVYEYLKAGADHISLGGVCFNPFRLKKILGDINN